MPLFCSGICARELVEVALSKRDIIVCGRACPLFRSGMRASQLDDTAPVGSRRPVDDRCNRRRVAGGRQLVGGRPAGRVLLSECASRSNDVAMRAYSLCLRAAGAFLGSPTQELTRYQAPPWNVLRVVSTSQCVHIRCACEPPELFYGKSCSGLDHSRTVGGEGGQAAGHCHHKTV